MTVNVIRQEGCMLEQWICKEGPDVVNYIVSTRTGPGQPDGMAADYEGNLWIALWGGFGVACVDTDTGHVIRKIEMPMPNVSSICFGGDDGRKVLITTAYKDLTPEGRKKYPQAGTVWFGNIGARGPEFYRCRGGLP